MMMKLLKRLLSDSSARPRSVCVCDCVFVWVGAYYMQTNICTHTCTHTHSLTGFSEGALVRAATDIYIHTHLHTHTHTHTHTHSV
jgi:hypothetical protein